ncbi:MAG: 23S rRNA (uracil(1939)-C(5))-methyltransferase RlmD [Vampirovibrionales bacterium]|nr:23S rRNA (uracil(1939)-C(5))-methyltransferase RlmD [Vampirovibrionales bacterium]
MPSSKTFRARQQAPKQSKTTTVNIEKLVYGGDGLARMDSQNPEDPRKAIVWVADSIPGETVTIEAAATSRSKKAPLKGIIQSIEAPSVHRVQPTCQHALAQAPERCGGCQWQHMDTQAQLEWKGTIVAESFERLAKLPNVTIKPTLGNSPWHYRHTITWEVVTLPNGNLRLGFHQRESNTTIAISECPIAAPPLEALLKTINNQPELANELLQGIQRVKARATDETTILLGLEPRTDEEPIDTSYEPNTVAEAPQAEVWDSTQALEVFQTLRETHPNLKALWQLIPTEDAPEGSEPQLLWGESVVTTRLQNIEYSISLPHFTQAQPQGTEQLLTTLHQAIASVMPTEAKTTAGKTIVWDGYCGMGLFGLSIMASPLGAQFSKVIGVEGDLTSVELASLNSAQLGISHRSQWHAQAVEDYIADWYLEASLAENLAPNRITIGIIDPPRTGAKPVVLDWLAEHTDKAIIYISCNPSTLARDCRHLTDNGWQLAWVQPVDCFPQTYHIECVALLTPAPKTEDPSAPHLLR